MQQQPNLFEPHHDSSTNCGGTLRKTSDGRFVAYCLDDFEIGRTLGQGSFGLVYLARERKTKFIVALKIIFKNPAYEKGAYIIAREIEIQMNLRDPNVLRMYGYFYDPERIFLIMEYAGQGDLYAHLCNTRDYHLNKHNVTRCFDELTAAHYVSVLAKALDYCHSKGVIHRDLKPENILIDADGNLKVGDFGWAIHVWTSKRKTMCGTLDYLSPELVNSQTYDYRVDIWALGVLCYEFLYGHPPFEQENMQDTKNLIAQNQVRFPRFFPADACDLISKLLQTRPADRLPLNQVQYHPFIVRHLGHPDQRNKGDLKEVLQVDQLANNHFSKLSQQTEELQLRQLQLQQQLAMVDDRGDDYDGENDLYSPQEHQQLQKRCGFGV